MSHVRVTINDEEPIVVNAIPHPGAPGSLVDLTRTVENAFKVRNVRNPEAHQDDHEVETFRILIEEYVLDAEDDPRGGSEENVGAQFGNAPAVQGGHENAERPEGEDSEEVAGEEEAGDQGEADEEAREQRSQRSTGETRDSKRSE